MLVKEYSWDETIITYNYSFQKLFGSFALIKWNRKDNFVDLVDFEIKENYRKKGFGKLLFFKSLQKASALKIKYIRGTSYDDKNAKHFWEHVTKRKFGRGIIIPVQQALKDIDECGEIKSGTCIENIIKNTKSLQIYDRWIF